MLGLQAWTTASLCGASTYTPTQPPTFTYVHIPTYTHVHTHIYTYIVSLTHAHTTFYEEETVLDTFSVCFVYNKCTRN